MSKKHKLPDNWRDTVTAAVAQAEGHTSAEVKVVVLNHCWIDIREKARKLFAQYGLHHTKQRNAVMILVVLANREFLVYGDKGIHEKVDDDFWLHVRDAMLTRFREGKFVEGVCEGVKQVGEKLAVFYPRMADDENELSNEVIHED